MSAFMLDPAHIDVMIDLAQQYGPNEPYEPCLRWITPLQRFDRLFDRDLTDVGRMLLAEHAASIATCYRTPMEPCALTYIYRKTHRYYTPAQALKTLDCYEYQSCDRDGWATSEAKAFCHALRAAVVRQTIPQSAADPWGWTNLDLMRRDPNVIDDAMTSASLA